MLLKEHRYDDLSKNVHFLQTTTAEKLGAAIAAFHGESYSVAPINSKTGVELMAPIETGTTGGAYIIYLLQKERYRADLMVECLRERKYAVAEQVVTQACMEGLIDTVAATQQDNIGEAEGILKTTADGRSFMKAQCNPDIGDYIEMIEKLTKEWGGDAFQH